MGDTASGDPDKMADYQDEGSEQTDLWGDEITNLEAALARLRTGMDGMPGSDGHLSLMIPDYATVLSETKTAQVSLDNWVKDVGEALREAGTEDPDTGLFTANESSLDVPSPEMPSASDPAQAAADVRELLWDSQWLLNADLGVADYDLNEEEFLALMAEISVYMEDPEYAAEFYGEMGVDGIRAMTLAFFTSLNGPSMIANPGGPVSEADQIEDIQVLLTDPLYMSFVDGFARATTSENDKMAELEAALLEMNPYVPVDPFPNDNTMNSPRILLEGFVLFPETNVELQLSLLLSADPALYDDGFLERAAEALGVETGDLDTYLEERLGSAPGTSLDHLDTALDEDAASADEDDPTGSGWEAETRDDGTGFTPSDDADSPDAWTVGNNDSFWAVSEELLIAQGILDPADKGSPEYERTVWEFHVQLIELNTDTDGVISEDLIYEGAALVLPDPTDLNISADTGSGEEGTTEETPTEETPTEETDPANGSEAEFTAENRQYDEPIGPGLGDDNETVSLQGSGGWDEFGLDDPDVVATVLADPEGYNLNSDYVAAASETLVAESEPWHDYEDRRRLFVAVRALAQDTDASTQFVNASVDNKDLLEGDIPLGGAASSEYEGMTLNEVWRDAADQVLSNADPTSEGGRLVVEG